MVRTKELEIQVSLSGYWVTAGVHVHHFTGTCIYMCICCALSQGLQEHVQKLSRDLMSKDEVHVYLYDRCPVVP